MSIFRRTPRTSGKHCADAFDGEPSRLLAPVATEARPPAPRPPWDQAVTWKRPTAPVRPASLARLYRIGAPAVPAPPLAAPFYDALNGSERTARACIHCGAPDLRDDPRWRDDALLRWSCPSCQAQDGWRAPYPPVLYGEAAEHRLICAAAVVSGDPSPGFRHYLRAPWRNPVGRAS